MANEFSNDDDTIQVRDIIERVERLRSLRQPGPVDTGDPDDDETCPVDLFAELASLETLLLTLEGEGGDEQWEGEWYPQTLIRDSHFRDYARELCEEIGAIPKNFPNYIEIDWEKTARNIRMDYSAFEFEGVTYWAR